MQTQGGATYNSDQHSKLKPRKPKSREVSSRFLSPTSNTTPSTSNEYGIFPSPNSNLSPLQQRPRSLTDSRKQESSPGFSNGIWPSSSPYSNSKKSDTLATHFGNEKLKDLTEKSNNDSPFLTKQRSYTVYSRFDNGIRRSPAISKEICKENMNPSIGGSERYTGKFKFPGKSSKSPNVIDDQVLPSRFSIDEIGIRRKSISGESENSNDLCMTTTSFDTPISGKNSPAPYMAPTMSSRKHGIEVPSKFMYDSLSRSRRWSADSILNQKLAPSSPKKFSIKNPLKRTNSKWALSPGRSGSPSGWSDVNGNMMGSKPPTSPSKSKGVANFFSIGIAGLLKGRKSSSKTVASSLGPGSSENVHRLRLLHNSLIQWRFANARADAVSANMTKHTEYDLLCTRNSLIKLQHSVVKKRIQLQEKLEMKLQMMIHSQIKALEIWGRMERQHLNAVSVTKDYLHAAVCKIPLVEGAKVDKQSASRVFRHASDVASSMNLMLTTFSPTVEKAVRIVGELACVVRQEKLLLEECLELFRIISKMEIHERSLNSSVLQLKLLQQLVRS